MSVADCIIIAVVAVLAVAALVFIIKKNRRGQGCSCGCESCAYKCSKRQEDNKNLVKE